MIAAWMLYSLLLGAAVSVAAWGVERATAAHGRPLRGIWLGAMALTLALPLLLGSAGSTPASSEAPAAPAVDRSGLDYITLTLTEVVRPATPVLERSGPWLTGAWLIASLIGGLMLCGGLMRLARLRRSWSYGSVSDTTVRISDDFGPAVVGLAHPEIVLPRWATDLSAKDQALVVAHETEHRAAGDTRILATGLATALVMPWNLPLLWQLRRLRRATELDCDRRVLRRGVSPLAYGDLLVRMGERMSAPVPFAATLTEPRTLLERRIRMITRRENTGRVTKTMMATGLAVMMTVVACESPQPTELLEETATLTLSEGVDTNDADTQAAAKTLAAAGTLRLTDWLSPTGPLIVVDGVITDRELSDLTTMDIESIEVFKGGAAAELYGERAKNGVINIKTKKAGKAEFKVQEVSFGEAAGGRIAPNAILRLDAAQAEYSEVVVDGSVRGGMIIARELPRDGSRKQQ